MRGKETHPRHPWKSWEKPHKKSPIPGTPENPGRNLTKLRICLLVVGFVVGSDKPRRNPLQPAGAKSARAARNIFKFKSFFAVVQSLRGSYG